MYFCFGVVFVLLAVAGKLVSCWLTYTPVLSDIQKELVLSANLQLSAK